MSAPLFLLPAGALTGAAVGSRLPLDGAEGRHAATVRRITPGERVDVADGAGAVARCTVVSAVRDALTLRVDALEILPEPSPRLVLVQALAKGERDDLAVEAATELGVDEVVPWQAPRSRRKWEHTVRAAAKQSRRARVPVVAPLASGADVRARVAAAELAVLLHEEAETPLAGVALPAAGDVLLVVGPEGGIGPEEVAGLVTAGAVACRLGPHVLRSSTAGPAALAVLSAGTRWR